MTFVPWTPPRLVVLELRALARRINDLTIARTREKNKLAAADATMDPLAGDGEDA